MDVATTSTIITKWRRRRATGTTFYVSAFLLMTTALLLASSLPVADCSSQQSSSTKEAARTGSLIGVEGSKAAAYVASQILRLPIPILSALLRSFVYPLLRSARVIWSGLLSTVAQCEAMLSKATMRALNSSSVSVGQLTRLPRSATTALLRSFLVPLFRSVRVTWSAFLSMVAQCETLLLEATGHALTSLFIKPANAAVEGLSQLVYSALRGVLRLAQSTASLVTSPLGFFDTSNTTSAGVSTRVGRPRTETQDAPGKSKSTEEGLVQRHLDALEWLLAEAGAFILESYLWGSTSRALCKAGLKLLVLNTVMNVVKDPMLRLAFSLLFPFVTLLFIPRN